MAGKGFSASRHVAKAASLLKSGDASGARALYDEVLARFPGNKAAKIGLAKCETGASTAQTVLDLYSAGNLAEARRIGENLIKSDPKNLLLLNLLGAINGGLNVPHKAIEYLRQSVKLDPAQANSHANLGKALSDAGQHDAAINSLRKSLSLAPNQAVTLNNLGIALVKTGKIDDGLSAYRKALKAKPDYAEAKVSLAMALNDLGQRDEAIALCHEALAINPKYTLCYRNLSTLIRFAATDPLIAQMQTLLASLPQNSEDAMNLHFALAKVHSDLGDIDASFAALDVAGRIHTQRSGYKVAFDAEVYEQTIKIFNSELFRAPFRAPSLNKGVIRPVLIVGMPRSGTTLVEQILASHSAVHGAGEVPFLHRRAARLINLAASGQDVTSQDLQGFAQGYLDDLSALDVSQTVICDKTPSNFRFLGFVFATLPDAKVIHINRDPMAVGWSVFKHYFPASGMDYSYDQENIAGYYGLYEKIMAFWRTEFDGRFLDVNYETLTENQEPQSRRILEHCELDWEPAVLEFHRTKRSVQTASTAQVRQPMYKGSSDAWRAYDKHLEPLRKALERLPKA